MTPRHLAAGWIIVAGLASSCTHADPFKAPEAVEADHHAPDAGSIFDLDVALTDDAGRHLTLANLRGRLIVAAMIYTSCTSVCPLVTEDMKALERQLSAADADRLSFLLFSIDPGRDTPQALHKFADDHKLSSRWRLFAASDDGVRTIAAALGVQYQPQASGEIAHSATIVVIDGAGAIRYRKIGTGDRPAAFVDVVRHVVRCGPNG